MEYLFVEKQESTEALILGRGGDVLVHSQVSEVFFDLGRPHLQPMPFVVEKDVAFDPVDVSLLGADGVVLGPCGVANVVEQFLFTVLCHGPPA